jgi:alpha-ribazole phosphatase/probable phosphoglycerate mutase
MQNSVIYLMTCGRTENDEANKPRITDACQDEALSCQGKQQVAKTAAILQQRGISSVYCSPQLHCLQTVAPVVIGTDLLIHLMTDLRDVHTGEWKGRTWDAVSELDDPYLQQFRRDPGTNGYPHGENFYAVQDRMVKTLYKIAEQQPGKTVLVVTHPLPVRVFLTHLVGLSLHQALHIDQDPGCVNILRYSGGAFSLGACNQTLLEDYAAEVDEAYCG